MAKTDEGGRSQKIAKSFTEENEVNKVEHSFPIRPAPIRCLAEAKRSEDWWKFEVGTWGEHPMAAESFRG
jgi:hypothetical protein